MTKTKKRTRTNTVRTNTPATFTFTRIDLDAYVEERISAALKLERASARMNMGDRTQATTKRIRTKKPAIAQANPAAQTVSKEPTKRGPGRPAKAVTAKRGSHRNGHASPNGVVEANV